LTYVTVLQRRSITGMRIPIESLVFARGEGQAAQKRGGADDEIGL
jgi:hypothetical protein